MLDSKACSVCGVVKPLDDFHRRNMSADKRNAACKQCKAERDATRVVVDLVCAHCGVTFRKLRLQGRQPTYCSAGCRDERQRALGRYKSRRWADRNPVARRSHFLASYGLTIEQYEAMVERQNGVCAICGDPPSVKPLCIDHDHETGSVRSLLCIHCNLGLGAFRDSAERMRLAADYVEIHTASPSGFAIPAWRLKKERERNARTR